MVLRSRASRLPEVNGSVNWLTILQLRHRRIPGTLLPNRWQFDVIAAVHPQSRQRAVKRVGRTSLPNNCSPGGDDL